MNKATLATNISVGFLVATAVQPYACPQSTTRMCCNLRYEYIATEDPAIADPSVPRTPAFQYVELSNPGPGEATFRMVPAPLARPPIDPDLIARRAAIVHQLVAYLQRNVPAERIVKLVAEFALDENGHLWLVYTTDVRTEPSPMYALEPEKPLAAAGEAEEVAPTALTALGAGALRDVVRPTYVAADGSVQPVHYIGVADVPPISIRDLTELKGSVRLHPHIQVRLSRAARAL